MLRTSSALSNIGKARIMASPSTLNISISENTLKQPPARKKNTQKFNFYCYSSMFLDNVGVFFKCQILCVVQYRKTKNSSSVWSSSTLGRGSTILLHGILHLHLNRGFLYQDMSECMILLILWPLSTSTKSTNLLKYWCGSHLSRCKLVKKLSASVCSMWIVLPCIGSLFHQW